MAKPLEEEFRYYLGHQDDLVAEYDGKVLVIKGQQVIGVYDDEGEAVEKTAETHELGTFLVQLCSPGTDAYTAVFHSRVLVN